MNKKTKTAILILILTLVITSAIVYYFHSLPNDNYLLSKNGGTIEGIFYKTENWDFLVVDTNEHVYRFGYAPGANTDGMCYGDKIRVSYAYEKQTVSNSNTDTSYRATLVELIGQ